METLCQKCKYLAFKYDIPICAKGEPIIRGLKMDCDSFKKSFMVDIISGLGKKSYTVDADGYFLNE